MYQASIPGFLDSTAFLESQLNDKQLKRKRQQIKVKMYLLRNAA